MRVRRIEPIHQRRQMVKSVHPEDRGRSGPVAETEARSTTKDGLKGDARSAALAGQDIRAVGNPERAQRGVDSEVRDAFIEAYPGREALR